MAIIKPSTPFDSVQRKFAKTDESYDASKKTF